ncbi:YjcZ family sporulation protein [Bacillus salipaludis]
MSYSYAAPVYASCFPTQGCGEFILIVVLFILLIIVGAVCFCV